MTRIKKPARRTAPPLAKVEAVAKAMCALRWLDPGERFTPEFVDARWARDIWRSDYRASAKKLLRYLEEMGHG